MSATSDCISYLNTTNWHRVALLLLIALLGIGFGVGFSVSTTNARKDADDDYSRRLGVFTEWQMTITSHFARASSLAASVGAYVTSSATVPMNFSASAADRVVIVNNDAFMRLGSDLFAQVPGILALQLQSGGVISQSYPPGSAPIGLEVIFDPVDAPVYNTLISTGLPMTAGPAPLAQGGLGIFIRYPVFINATKSRATFWGTGNVIIRMIDLLAALDIDELLAEVGMDYSSWYTNSSGMVNHLTSSPDANNELIREQGMRMSLPFSEEGKSTYLAIYPQQGPVSPDITTGTILSIVFAVLFGSAVVVALLYFGLLLAFLHRHRHAPATRGTVYMATISLRGAQPVAERAPIESVRMFAEFMTQVRLTALKHKCYVVCDIGDRSVFVVAANPTGLMKLAQEVVGTVTIQSQQPTTHLKARKGDTTHGGSVTVTSEHRTITSKHTSPTHSGPSTRRQSAANDQSTLLVAMFCHPSAGCHAAIARRHYDPIRDVYFYGGSSSLGPLGQVADCTASGEVGWSDDFDKMCAQGGLRGILADGAISTHNITELGEAPTHVACWWQAADGDDRDSEDPSMAMTILNDVYVRKMMVLASDERMAAKKGSGSKGGSSDGSSGSAEATILTRSATILTIAVYGELRSVIDHIRKAVAEEKGAVVSANENTVVAAFNLLSPTGQHHLRAAEAVSRLRVALQQHGTPFVCAISSGKVNAFIADGVVMCTGDPVATCRMLQQRAIELGGFYAAETLKPYSFDVVSDFMDKSASAAVSPALLIGPNSQSGLCLLLSCAELAGSYDCEAIDLVASANGKPRLLYRLAEATSVTDDEWMYQLKEGEEKGAYAASNAVLKCIAEGDIHKAKALWEDLIANNIPLGMSTSGIRRMLNV
eukprot:GILI01008942.1.p1 GENE.GILI01008942.1~~GILI01008942.1.p1  ORF type:complete len:882 (+),score=184.76 GILI01008942.1:476-3121(+)